MKFQKFALILSIVAASTASADPGLIVGPITAGSGTSFGAGVACIGGKFAPDSTSGDFAVAAPGNDETFGYAQVQAGDDGRALLTLGGTELSPGYGSGITGVGDVAGGPAPDFMYGDPRAGGAGEAHIASYGLEPIDRILSGDGLVTPDAGFGASVAGLFQDISGDGRPDVVVGAPVHGIDTFQAGHLSFWTGEGTLLNECQGEAFEQLGSNIVPIGDVVGAEGGAPGGKPDLLVSSPGSGGVYLYAGESIANASCADRLFISSVGAFGFGSAMADVGDLDKDGINDFVIGAPLAEHPSGIGVARLYSGATRTVLCVVSGGNGGLGSAVQGIGDFDGDGTLNFIVSAPDELEGAGIVNVHEYDALDSNCPVKYTIPAPSNVRQFGRSLSSGNNFLSCDLDGNGFQEFIVGGQTSLSGPNTGAAMVYANITPLPTPSPTPSASPTASPTETPPASPTPFPSASPTESPSVTPSRAPTETPTPINGPPTPDPTLVPSSPEPTPTVVINVLPTAQPTPEPIIKPRIFVPKRARLGFKIAIDGTLAGQVKFDQAPTSLCTTTLIGRTSDANLQNAGPVKTLVRNKRSRLTTKFLGYGIKKVEMDQSCNKPYILHMITKTKCVGATKTLSSNVASRYLTCGAEPTLSLRNWEQDFARRIR